MKKLILFFLLISSAVLPLCADWQAEAAKFQEVDRDVGFKTPAEFTAFLDRAEGTAQKDSGALARFADNPVGFLQESGVGVTILLILLGGLALNLTPCVLPMIPVNIAIIGAGAQSESRAKGFVLGGTYGLGIASVYGVLGLVAIFGGKGFGALNASPWFNLGIAAIFVLLALSMFGLLHIDFSRFQSGREAKFKSRFATAFFMGGIAALLAGACVAPVVLAVLLLAGNLYAAGSAAGLFFPFLLGLGMALPWPFAGAGFTFLPKPGRWMDFVKYGFGVIILLMALYYGKLGLSLLGGGKEDPAIAGGDLASELAAAAAEGEKVFLDFGADWCKNCKQMEAETFPNEQVQTRLAKYRFVKIDATQYDQSPAAEILTYFGVQGLPTYIILEPTGE
jgi:thiol:disulfide interchange protein